MSRTNVVCVSIGESLVRKNIVWAFEAKTLRRRHHYYVQFPTKGLRSKCRILLILFQVVPICFCAVHYLKITLSGILKTSNVSMDIDRKPFKKSK